MKILHVLNSPSLGGTESWVLNFIVASPDGVDNELVLFDEHGAFRADMAPHLRGVVRGGVSRPRRIGDMLRLCRESNADQVWLHSDLGRTYGAFLPERRHRMCIAVCHSPWGARTVLERLGGIGRRHGWNGVITVSEALFGDVPASATAGHLAALVPPPRVVISQDRERIRRAEECSLLYVARLVDGKGHEALVRALPLVLQDRSDARLVLVGEGPLEGHLAEVVTQLGIDANVTFVGGTTDVATYLGAADIFVNPSESEGFAISGLEAALAGLPIVARPLPCYAEYLHPGLNGVTFEEPADATLARAICEVRARLPQFTAGAAEVCESIAGRLLPQFHDRLADVLVWR